jgi:N-acetylglutamate synthase-like GNAT family acetyltransferase
MDYEEEIRSYPVWVAESDGILVGGLILMPEADHMTIANVAVHPNFQGNGLGRSFMAIGEAEAKRQGFTELRIATHVLLTENISLYTHLRWSETGRDEYRVYLRKKIT